MKIEIDDNTIRLKGSVGGNNRHIKIWCKDNVSGVDMFQISVIKDGMEIACGESYIINDKFVIRQRGQEKECL